MPQDKPELIEVFGRLERVEKENRRLRRIGLVVTILAGSLMLMGQAPRNSTVVAEKFVLKDVGGRVRGELGMLCHNSPCLRLYDNDGNPLTRLSTWGLLLSEREATARKDSSDPDNAHEDIQPPLVQLSQTGLLVLGANKRDNQVLFDWTDSPSLMLLGKQGRIDLSSSSDGPSLALWDTRNFSTVIGSTSLETTQTGETHKTSAASILLFGHDKVLWSAP